MDCYRNVFSRAPNEVEALAAARVKPDWTGELPTTCLTSPWHPKICDRLMGAVARGWLVPKVTGEYTFIHIVNTSEMKFMLSSDADVKNLREVKLVPGKGFGDVHVVEKSKTESVRVVDKAAYNPKPIRLEKGRRYAFRLYAIAGRACEPPRFEWACAYNSADKEADIDDVSLDAIGEEDESLGPAVNRKVTAVREPIPASGLAAEKEGEWAAPREFAATPVGTGGEEPDGLSRENLAINHTAMREYLAFARAGKAQVAAGSPRKVPYARLPLSGNKLAFAVKASGDYRLWIRYRHRKGYNCYMDTTIFRKDDPYTPVHHQLFGRGITKYGSCTTDYPTPQLMHIPEATETGFRWECSSRMLHLEPGEYVATIDHGWGVPLNCDIDFKGVVLDGDPMREPGEKDVIKEAEYGERELSSDAVAHAALLKDAALFERWRTAFIRKLEAPDYYRDYDLGFLATRALFDPDLNAIGKPCELAALKRSDAMGFHGGVGVNAEVLTNEGRIDMTCETAAGIWLIEFKLDRPAEEALQQIDERNYAEKYDFVGKAVKKLGLSFSSEQRTITDWRLG